MRFIKQKYLLSITPAISPEERHTIEDCLNKLDYEIIGGGAFIDGSKSDISFQKKDIIGINET